MENNRKIIWEPSFSVGNQILDEQHKKLLSLCNQALECISIDSLESRALFHSILNDLVAYTETHFRTEEGLLTQSHYSQLDAHKAEHTAYQIRLTDFLLDATIGNVDREGLQQYLSTWWREHILEQDMQYAEHLKSASQQPAEKASSNLF